MPDITKCDNKECPLRSYCYRFTAEPDPDWQSYAHFEPAKTGLALNCDCFISMKRGIDWNSKCPVKDDMCGDKCPPTCRKVGSTIT